MAHSKFTPTGLNSHNHQWFQSFLMPLLKFNRIISCSLFERGNQNNLWLQGHILSIISSKPKQYISGFYFEVFFYFEQGVDFFIESNAIATKVCKWCLDSAKKFCKMYMPEMTRDKLLPKIYFGQLDSR